MDRPFRSLPLLYKSEKHVAEPASGQTLHQPDVLSPKSLHDSQRDTIWVQEQHDWGLAFYTRIDLQGYFHTYPHVGGPFHSLEDVSDATDQYLHDRRDPMMCEEPHEFYEVGKASMERDVVRYKLIIYEANCYYYHINFAAKTKGAKTTDNLFFAEVARMPGEDGKLVVSCTCMVDPFDNGPHIPSLSVNNGHCYGCGSNMKHPNADAYTGGRSKVSKVFHIGDGCPGPKRNTANTIDDWKAEEARVRRCFEGLDDPSVVAPLMEPPKFKFGAKKEVKRFMESVGVMI